ncbi:MAG TPA: type II secretion system protein [Terriglobales bacterium]|jgi:prepilin-type N-terminal cleavage/methylation domain-containing protein|nr:type II secretion system protein [Terriglobales bacterium]
MKNMDKSTRKAQSGFSLIEMLIVIAILTIVLGIVMKELVDLQRLNMDQSARIDLTQEARQFLDQISLDMHQSGYPGARLFDQTNLPTADKIANGLTAGSGHPKWPVDNGMEYVSPTEVQFEGDIDGSGQVSEVFVQLILPAGGNCTQATPCTLRRGVLPKALAMAGAVPTYYTELTGVMNNNVFTARDSAGNIIALPATDPNDLGNIRSIDITIQVQSPSSTYAGQFPLITLVSGAKINSVLN